MDIQILLALQNFREATGQCLNSFFAFMTTIAVDYWVIVPALIMFWIVDKRNGLIMLFSSAIGRYVNALLKAVFCVYRPWVRSDAIKPLPEVMSGATGYSFPSGHASSVGNFYGALIIICIYIHSSRRTDRQENRYRNSTLYSSGGTHGVVHDSIPDHIHKV